MNDLIDTTEMYLRTIFELQEEGIPPLRARIAERLEHSGPTVSQTVSRMERDGLLRVESDRQIMLTDTGQQLAARVMRKHRLAECLLIEVIGMPRDTAHAEACRWEHVISDEVERLLYVRLGEPTHSPYGTAIPALAELNPNASADQLVGVPLSEVADDRTRHVQIVSLDESAQGDVDVQAAFARVGLAPASTVKCRRVDDRILIGSGGEYTEVSLLTAAHIVVLPPDPQV